MAKSNLKVSGVYLLGQLFDDRGPVPNSRYFPLRNVCFAHKDDSEGRTVSYDGKGHQTQTPPKAALLYSDALGKITYFNAPESLDLGQNLPLQGNPASATTFASGHSRLLFFPPYLAPIHLMSEEGKDGKWLANLYNSLISGAETKPLENYYQVSEQSDYSISELLPSKEVGDKHYAAAIGKLEDSIEKKQLSTLKAIVLPQKYTIVVHFSDANFVRATVTLSNFPSQLRITGDAGGSNLTAVSTVKEVKFKDIDGQEKNIYSATFWVSSDSIFKLDEASQHCRFDIDLSTVDRNATAYWLRKDFQKKYSFCERVLHLPISTPLGRSALVNGNPISVEEALFNQASHLYPNLLEKLKQSPTDLPEKLASESKNAIAPQIWHSVQSNKAYIESAAQTMQHKLSWQTVAKVAAASVGGSADSEMRNIAGATEACLSVISKANDLSANTAAFGQSQIDMIKLFGDKGNILFDKLKDKINLIEVPSQWRQLLQDTQIAEKIGKGFTLADVIIKGGNLVEAYNKDDKASKRLDSVVLEYLATVQQPGMKSLASIGDKALLDAETKALEQLKNLLPKLGDNDELSLNTEVKKGRHIFELRSTTFAFDRSDSNNPKARANLIELGGILSQIHRPIPITIKGHTCSRGSIEYNQTLSEERASYIRECILEGITSNQAVWKTCIRAIGLGEREPLVPNDSEDQRRRNRRVDLLLHFEAILDYPVSRGGLTVVEKSRQMMIANEMQLDAATLDAIELALDTALDVASVTPLGATANFIYTVGKAGSSLFSNLYDFITEEADTLKLRNNLEKIQYQNIVSQEQILSFGSESLSDEMKSSYYKRAHALNGLSRLLLERNYQEMSGDHSNVSIENINDYIKLFLLNDQWQLNENGFGMVHLDEFFMDSDYAQAELSLLKASTYSAYAQLGASIAGRQLSDWYSDAEDSESPRPFMEYSPIHYMASANTQALVKMFEVPFKTEDLEALYKGAKQSISVKTARDGAPKKWIAMDEFLAEYGSLSPFDEVRIIVVLAKEAVESLEPEKRRFLHRVGIEVQARWNWSNYSTKTDAVMEGSKIVNKSSEYLRDIKPIVDNLNLTSKEQALFNQKSDDETWGVIIEPSFVFGVNKIKGTRPWIPSDSPKNIYLNRLFEEENRELRTGELPLEYEYLAGIKGVNDSFEPINYDFWGTWGISTFDLSLSPSRLYQFGKNKDIKHADHLLVSGSFLSAPKPDADQGSFPKVFDDPTVELHIMQQGLEGKYSDFARYYKEEVEDFDWSKWVNCLAVVKTKHCPDTHFSNLGFAPGKVIGVEAKLRAVELTNNIDFLPGVSGGTHFTLGKEELYRIGTIVEKDNEWQFDVMTSQKHGAPLKTELSTQLESLRQSYSRMSSNELKSHAITNLVGLHQKTDIYAQIFKPEYVNVLGSKVAGLKPFKRVEKLVDNFHEYIDLQLELIGPIGSGLHAQSEKLKLNIHAVDREDIPVTWYKCKDELIKGAEEILKIEDKTDLFSRQEIVSRLGKTHNEFRPILEWLDKGEARPNRLSDDQIELINDWILNK
ncbi:OmpA family protein [Vibrio sp. OPT41]|uniref:OmpA family protein n=2 Tax=unclassified Vibrio TaxID=2614977 RepID=UPI002AD26D9C|nr:OmpA family protein [Vibrio sp. OPT41]